MCGKKIDEVVLKKLFNAFKIFSASRYALPYGNGFSPTYRKKILLPNDLLSEVWLK